MGGGILSIGIFLQSQMPKTDCSAYTVVQYMYCGGYSACTIIFSQRATHDLIGLRYLSVFFRLTRLLLLNKILTQNVQFILNGLIESNTGVKFTKT